jgi:hypothetical protein
MSLALCRSHSVYAAVLTVMLVGERESLADFQEMEPELAEQAFIANTKTISRLPMPMIWRSGVSGYGRC